MAWQGRTANPLREPRWQLLQLSKDSTKVTKSRQQAGLKVLRTMRAAQAEGQGIHFRLPSAAPLHCPIVLPFAPSMLPLAPSVLSLAPSVLPLKRPCSLSRPGTAIPNPKFGVYIISIFMYWRMFFGLNELQEKSKGERRRSELLNNRRI